MQDHVKIVGWLHIAYSIVTAGIGVMILLVMAGAGFIAQDKTAFLITSGVGVIIAVTLCVLAVPGIIAGLGLLKLRPWARILAIIVGALHLLSFPLGTALGAYTIAVMLNDGVRAMFEPASAAAPSRVGSAT